MKPQERNRQAAFVDAYYSEAASRLTGGAESDAHERSTFIATKAGYPLQALESIPHDANLGLGCGNPHSIGALSPGERVLDIGSGGGIDCFIAARQVGETGHVIGVDMSEDMIELARRNARDFTLQNVEFRLGQVETLPVEEQTIDVVISNCVINLVEDKERAYENIYKALKIGGRLAISDTVVIDAFPPILENGFAYRPIKKDEYASLLRKIGFSDVSIEEKGLSCFGYNTNDPVVAALKEVVEDADELAGLFTSVYVRGTRR